MNIALGIDTGGTYTDAVLVDQDSGTVLAATKALTTHHDLYIGIAQAIQDVFAPEAHLDGHAAELQPDQVRLVGLSTTLATNAIVEGQGSPVCLILIGYDESFIRQRAFDEELVTNDVVYVQGGHNGDGDELAPLDETAAREAILARRDKVAAFAVSGYFGVRNPTHELRVKALIEELTADGTEEGERCLSLPVTCGHELTTRLNAIRRATTVTLNARLIAILRDLIITVRGTLDDVGVSAPLMIVKGDGSLVRSDWAILRPIETILSGPASSVVGAWYVAGQKDVWVVDVGGTTTDIAVLSDGRPRLNPQGAHVGRWHTMVEAADVHTVGLGGDSHVTLGANGHGSHAASYRASDVSTQLTVGPQRVLPLSRLGAARPEVLDDLRRQKMIKKRPLLPYVGQYLVPRRMVSGLNDADQKLVERVQAQGFVALVQLAQEPAWRNFLVERVSRLVAQQAVMRVAFTPTDALHVLGEFEAWSIEAAQLGAELFASQLNVSPNDFCTDVIRAVSDRVTTELVTKVLSDEVAMTDWAQEPVATGLLARALNRVPRTDLACEFRLRQPMVAVGAPVAAYLPRSAEQLHTQLILPQHAGVANAVGAVVGSVVQRATVLIRPIDFGDFYRLHLPGNLGLTDSVRDFETIAACTAYAHEMVPPRLTALAQEAGARQVEVHIIRTDHTAPTGERADDVVFLETELTFTAVGRPATVEQELQ